MTEKVRFIKIQKVCYIDEKGEKKCLERKGHPFVYRKNIMELLNKAKENGEDNINIDKLLYDAEWNTQFVDKKFNPVLERLLDYEKLKKEKKFF